MANKKYKRFNLGGIISGAAGAITNLVGMGVGIAESAKANKALKQLEKERPELSVPSEMFEGLNLAEQTRDFQQQNIDRGLATSTRAALMGGARGGAYAENLATQFNEMSKNNAFMAQLQKQKQLQMIGQAKQQIQQQDLNTWQQAVSMANQRRVGGIQSAFGMAGGAGKSLADFGDSLDKYMTSSKGRKLDVGQKKGGHTYAGGIFNTNSSGGKLEGKYKGLKGEKKNPYILIKASTGEPVKTADNRIITMTGQETVLAPKDREMNERAVNGDKVAQRAVAKLFKQKRFV